MAWHVEGEGGRIGARCRSVLGLRLRRRSARGEARGGKKRVKSVVAWRAYSDVECMTRDDVHVVAPREDRAVARVQVEF